MIFLHVSVSIPCAQYPWLGQFFQSPQLCSLDSTPSNFSCVAQSQTKQLRLFWLKSELMSHQTKIVVELGKQPRIRVFCIGKQVTDWYVMRKVLKQLTVQSSCVLWVLRTATNRDSCSSCDHRSGTRWLTSSGGDCDCTETSSSDSECKPTIK